MGILNVTPDSFFDGGAFPDAKAIRARAETMADEGAHWLDIGAESSRPGAQPVTLEEELRRLLPALEAVENFPVSRSVDTYRAETARRALELGATMINDITACRADPEMPALIAEKGCPCVLMHMQGNPKTMQAAPQYEDIIDDISAFFEERITTLIKSGVREDQLWLDPGFGFGKTVQHNLDILRRLGEFQKFGRPLLIGTSNKSTIGAILDLPLQERTEGTAATVALAIAAGASCVRVHDVKTMARVAKMTDAVCNKPI